MKHLSDKLNWDDIYRQYTLDEIPWEIKRQDSPLNKRGDYINGVCRILKR